jgi:23S rRNA pseudouridine1911/1915/1917 synthase
VDDLPQRLDFEGAEPRCLEAAPEDAGRRLDHFLAPFLQEFSRASLQRMIRRGAVLVNGQEVRPSRRMRPGDAVSVKVPRILPLTIEPEAMPLDILMDDATFAVINKPAGLAVHPGRGRDSGTLANALAHHFAGLSRKGGSYRPGIVHRLDMDTSGVMVVAKTEGAHVALSAAFKSRVVAKLYRAIVYGDPAHEEDRIEAPLGRDLARPERMAVRHDGGRDAITDVCLIERFGVAAHVEASPLTGRTHQIRVHLASRGHPILGDPIYARHRTPPVETPRLMLHAWRLTFPHPESGEPIEAEVPLPEDFRAVLEALRSIE